MKNSPRSIGATLPLRLGQLALVSVLLLIAWDAYPRAFPARAHDLLGAVPLALIAVTYLLYQAVRRPGPAEFLKAILLAAAFLLWAANQFWPEAATATLFNDLAIALFVFDVFLVVAGWPGTAPRESFAETYSGATDHTAGGAADR
jgi:hypothetical protein